MFRNLINFDQKQTRVDIIQEFLNEVENDPELLKRDIVSKAQLSQWKLPEQSRMKKMASLIVCEGSFSVFCDFNALARIMSSCRMVIWSIRNTIWKIIVVCVRQTDKNAQNCAKTIHGKCTTIMRSLRPWSHTSVLVREFLAKNNTIMMPQLPYSPDIAPCDFFLFPKLKRTMEGGHFDNIKDKQNRWRNCTSYQKNCSRSASTIGETVAQMYYIWGDYFERNKTNDWWTNKKILWKIIIVFTFWSNLLYRSTIWVWNFVRNSLE